MTTEPAQYCDAGIPAEIFPGNHAMPGSPVNEPSEEHAHCNKFQLSMRHAWNWLSHLKNVIFIRKVVYFVWYTISKQNSPKLLRKYRATRNFLQIYFLTLLHNANEINANSTLVVCCYLQKTLYFLVFYRNIGLKKSTYESTDRIHQNKQGFEAKS